MLIIIFTGILLLAKDDIPIYTGKSNIFRKSFTEPFEILYAVLYDGDCYPFTNQIDGGVIIPIEYIKDELKKDGKTLADVAIFCHNHFKSPRFSECNLDFFKDLKRHGFKGSFLVYHTPSKKVTAYVRAQ